ncbi:immunoglobulin-like domain-containing protein [Parendozoicomonas haliclonae]|uniref:Chitinase D n=1 Tax=Parendozoicomonas haliclonae TaxID=1960125 RepID=A0A1X7AQD1_9GAMM|nr:immunoglobulin-like domain-containing protein [Parendozoicomonas haliclonae]SMA50514.1 Chitinase D precursor [Parendozoicomonas haliclonae]
MSKLKVLQLAVAAGIAAMQAPAYASGADMINPQGGVVVGYWHNWCDGGGYQGGNAPCVTLDEVDPQYNVVDVSFMKVYDTSEGRIPTFKLDPSIGLSEQQFKDQIANLNSQGRSVLIALGGADAHIELKAGDEQPFADEIIRLVETYGFDGLDIDLEQAAVTASDNQTVIPAALRIVKDHYRKQGKNFLITMAPEFPYLTSGGKYVPYITNLEGYYDWINPQFYNQGGDGLWIDGVGWIAQNNDELKEEFIYYISDSLVNGSRNFTLIPHNKLVFGIPANIDAAATGFIKDPQDLYNAFDRLSKQGQGLRGVMTWSVNWDMGTNASGQPYGEQFIRDYGSFIHGNTPVPPPVVPGKPVLTGVISQRVMHASNFDPMSGVSATDKEDGDLTSAIVVDGLVNTARVGDYSLTYTVTDSDNNTTTAKRVIDVHSEKPVLSGVKDLTLQLNANFAPLAGVSASDAEDGDLTADIKVTGQVDSATVGVYQLEYAVTDSADQTVTATRKVRVTDGSTCTNAWDVKAVYLADAEVSHNGSEWRAGWWTQGEEPGTTGEWGVWRKIGDSSCGGATPEPEPQPELEVTVEGLKSEYVASNGTVELALQLTTNEAVTVEAVVVHNGIEVATTSTAIESQGELALTIENAETGSHTLTVNATADDGDKDMLNQSFMVRASDEGGVTPPGDYPLYQAGTAYKDGDIVLGADGSAYQCKPWPYTGWCASASYAPGSSQYWKDAWDKL